MQLRPLENVCAACDRELAALAECVELRKRGVAWTFSELGDPADKLALLRVEGSILEPTAMLEIKSLSDHAMSARASILAERDSSPVLVESGRKFAGRVEPLECAHCKQDFAERRTRRSRQP